MLEVFNTLLKHLRLSVEFEANEGQGGSMGSVSLNSASKDNDEKIVQNAIIQTIGESRSLSKHSREAAVRKLLLQQLVSVPGELGSYCDS